MPLKYSPRDSQNTPEPRWKHFPFSRNSFILSTNLMYRHRTFFWWSVLIYAHFLFMHPEPVKYFFTVYHSVVILSVLGVHINKCGFVVVWLVSPSIKSHHAKERRFDSCGQEKFSAEPKLRYIVDTHWWWSLSHDQPIKYFHISLAFLDVDKFVWPVF